MDSFNDLTTYSIQFALSILPIVVPIILLRVLIGMWISFVRERYINSIQYVLLELVPPSEVTKTPAAMELFLHFIYETGGEGTWIAKYIDGKVRSWFSLEIVSVEGNVKFFIWTNVKHRSNVESQLYAQYPGIEVNEAHDYTEGVHYDPSKVEMMAAEWKLTAPDPYPIKTYVDYGLDKDVEEDQKVDPMTPMLEFMGSLTEGHQAWVQIIVRSHKKEDKDPSPFLGSKGRWSSPSKWNNKVDAWADTAKSEIQKIREDATIEKGSGDNKTFVNVMTKGKELKIAALERSVSKLAFDVGIRTIYIADKDSFNPSNIGGLFGTFKQFGSVDLNGFKPNITTDVDYPWQDFTGNKVRRLKSIILEDYKERAYHWKSLKGKKRKTFVLNVEELATIFHMPGSVVLTPSLSRVGSKKGAPPANLPI